MTTETIIGDCKERVALDMAFAITKIETKLDRKGFFKLYEQCLTLVYRGSAETALKLAKEP